VALVLTGTLSIDCNDTSCVSFTDTTGAYSVSNPTGWGFPNKEISEIVSVDFTITDSNGDDYEYTNAAYTPNADGTATICLAASNFLNGTDELVWQPGATYQFQYVVNFEFTKRTLQDEFTFPCCGSSLTTNLATNIAVEQLIGCASFVFSDVTGVYNEDYNPGGYGGPNPDYDDIDNTVISITLANGETVDITTFVPTAENHSITIQATDLGYTSLIPDQIIGITYSVYAGGLCRIGYKSTNVLFYCQTEACINSKIAQVLTVPCGCDGDEANTVNNITDMLFELDAIKIVAAKNMSCVDGRIEALLQKCKAGCSTC